MNTLKASYEILNNNTLEPQKYIESIARICYKSEDRITEDSNKKMIKTLTERNHLAMIEHFRFIATGLDERLAYLIKNISEYTNVTFGKIITASFSARPIIEALMYKVDVYGRELLDSELYAIYELMKVLSKEYNCKEIFENIMESNKHYDNDCNRLTARVNSLLKFYTSEEYMNLENVSDTEKLKHCWMSSKIICDRGVSHELVRMRKCSFAQESTRYVNYKTKGGQINIINILPGLKLDSKTANLDLEKLMTEWNNAMADSEKRYNSMIELGATPQIARSVLPNSTKTEIIVTANFEEWKHTFELRDDIHAHPQMREIITPMHKDVKSRGKAYELL